MKRVKGSRRGGGGGGGGEESSAIVPGPVAPDGAFWGCVVIAGAVVVGTLAVSHQSAKMVHHMTTTMAHQGDRIANTCEMMSNTSDRLATALQHHGDRLAATGERIASVAETIDANVNLKHC